MYDPAIPRILRGDPGRIRQILLNFLSNSIKFTDCGEVLLRVTLNSAMENSHVDLRFSVSDTGIGLNESAKEVLFQPFMQVDASITRKYGGTGLGLVISKRLVELMGGNIEFSSTYGKGSIFGFAVKLEIGANEQAPVVGPLPENMHDARILIIDGPDGTQQILTAYVSSWGIRCSHATDISKASLMVKHEAAANDPFDLVFFVLDPSNAEPVNLLSELDRDLAAMKTRLVVIGSCADRGFGRQVLEKGFAAYLPIPIRQSRLFDCIINQLDKNSTSTKIGENATAEIQNTDIPQPRNLILVVEDNTVNQKVALLQLRELGFSAHAVSNGSEALEAAAKIEYALILMDCQMPVMDGLQATKAIRKLEIKTGKHTPIVAMTANAMSGDRLNCLSAGMDDYISKPVNQKKLSDVLQRWLPAGSQMQTKEQIDSLAKITDSTKKPMEIEVLFTTYGNKAGNELLQSFQADAERLLQNLTRAVEQRDIVALKHNVHELKGTSASVYATELAELSRALEEAIAKDNVNLIEEHFRIVQAAWSRAKVILKDTLDSKDSKINQN